MKNIKSADEKAKRNCLLVFRNKKLNNFDGTNGIITSFAEAGYYFDKIVFVAYDNSEEITRAVKDGKAHYENIVVYCPAGMEDTLKNYLTTLYSAQFNEHGIMKSGNSDIFILFSDRKNKSRIDEIKRTLDLKYGVIYKKAFIKTVGAPAKEIHNAIEKAINAESENADDLRGFIDFSVNDSYGDCTIEIIYNDKVTKTTFDKIFRVLVSSLDDYVYSIENFSLAERLFQLLKLRRMKISVAESFTGGGVGKKLVDISGISEVYFEGLNTYSNESKIQRLGVSKSVISKYGPVSEQTAREMAAGLIDSGNCDISIATTGIAGPKSDSTSKPVGLIYIAIGTQDKISVFKYNLKGSRDTITNTAINLALFHAFKTLK